MTLNKEQFWHLTDDPNFKPDPAHRPTWNSLAGGLGDQPKGIFVSPDPEYWMQAHGYERPYVAEIRGEEVKDAPVYYPSHEKFLKPGARTKRVLTIDEYAREKFHEPGWVEDYHGPAFSMTQPLSEYRARNAARFPKNYRGRPTSEMQPEELSDYEGKFKEWTNRSR